MHTHNSASARRTLSLLGTKGEKTRRKLMSAAASLLKTTSPVSLTAAAISREAGTSPPTFYVYFDDVNDIVYELARAANDDIEEIIEALRAWREGLGPEEGARNFIGAFHSHWRKHRALLSIRNLEADRGEQRFLTMRQRTGMRIITNLADLVIEDSSPPVTISRREAIARTTFVYAAIERLAATQFLYPQLDPGMPTREDYTEAAIVMLVSLITTGS